MVTSMDSADIRTEITAALTEDRCSFRIIPPKWLESTSMNAYVYQPISNRASLVKMPTMHYDYAKGLQAKTSSEAIKC